MSCSHHWLHGYHRQCLWIQLWESLSEDKCWSRLSPKSLTWNSTALTTNLDPSNSPSDVRLQIHHRSSLCWANSSFDLYRPSLVITADYFHTHHCDMAKDKHMLSGIWHRNEVDVLGLGSVLIRATNGQRALNMSTGAVTFWPLPACCPLGRPPCEIPHTLL